MTYAAPLLESINSGEMSPRMEARVSFDRYPNAAKRLRNTVLLPQGGWTRRPGTRFVCEVADSADETVLVPFQYSQEHSYQVELGDGYARFMRRQARIEVGTTDAAVSNGNFDSGITSWSDISDVPTFPSIVRSTTGEATTGSVTAVVPLTSASSGQLLLFFISTYGGTALTITTPAGWTQLYHVVGPSNLRRHAAYYKVATGSEGSSVAVTISSTDNRWTSVCHTISGYQGTPEASTATGTSSAPNSPSLSPTWGSAKTLWLSVFGAGLNGSVTTSPTGYGGQVRESLSSSPYWSATVSMARGVEDATENPATYATSFSGPWVAATVAIRPAATTIRWDSTNARLELPEPVSGEVAAEQAVTIGGGYTAVEHVLKFTVAGYGTGTVFFRVGSTTGGQEILSEIELGPGYHAIAFTPGTTTFYLQFANRAPQQMWIDAVSFLSNVPMSLTTPYGPADWEFLRVYQGQNVLYLLHPDIAPRMLHRHGHRSWSLMEAFFEDGPYDPVNEGHDYIEHQAMRNPLFENGIKDWTDASTGDGYVDHQDDTHLAELDPGSSGGSGVAILRGDCLVPLDEQIVVHFLIAGAGPVGVKIGITTNDGTYVDTNYNAGWHSVEVTTTSSFLHVQFSYSEHTQARAAIGGVLVYPQKARLLRPGGQEGVIEVLAYGHTPFKSTDVGRLLRLNYPGHEPGYGVITAYTSTSQVTLQVLREIGTIAPTEDWSLGAWCADLGYPHTLGKFDGRLVVANTDNAPTTIWASQSGEPLNMRPDSYVEGGITVEDDDAIQRTLDGDHLDPIHWLNGKQQLVIGTGGGQWVGNSNGPVITPADMAAREHSATAGGDVKALAVEEITIYTDRSRRQLYEIGFKFDDNSFVSNDLTILADHILRSPVEQLVYQRRPFSTVWVRRADGVLATLAYNRQHEVLGWAQTRLGGSFGDGKAVVESISVIPGAEDAAQFYDSDERDELWMIVKRTINGATKRYVEVMEYFFEGPLREDYDEEETWQLNETAWRTAMLEAQKDAFYVDSGLTYSGGPATTITGLDHLEGQEVMILADGKVVTGKVVTAGAVTLPTAASIVHVGLAYKHVYESLKLAQGARGGTSVNKVKGVSSCGFVLLDCSSFKATTVEYDEQSGRRQFALQEVGFKRPTENPTAATPLFTGEVSINTDQAASTDPRIYAESDAPLPFTLIAVAPVLDGSDRTMARR